MKVLRRNIRKSNVICSCGKYSRTQFYSYYESCSNDTANEYVKTDRFHLYEPQTCNCHQNYNVILSIKLNRIVHHIYEVLSLNFGCVTCYPGLGFPWFSFVTPVEFQENTNKSASFETVYLNNLRIII